jgi:hypothetical protein
LVSVCWEGSNELISLSIVQVAFFAAGQSSPIGERLTIKSPPLAAKAFAESPPVVAAAAPLGSG